MRFIKLFETLGRILGTGNQTSGHDLVITDGDEIQFSDSLQYLKEISSTEVELDGNGAFRLNDTQGYSAHQGTYTPTSSTQTIDWNHGNSASIDLNSATGTVTLTLSNPKAGASYILVVIQGATARNITWPAAVKWPNGGGAPVISTGNDDIDVFSLFYDGTNYYGSFNQDYA